MAVDLNNALKISASGMKAQGTRLRVISENIANQDLLVEVKVRIRIAARLLYLKTFWTAS